MVNKMLEERKGRVYLQDIYRIYEFADGLCFPEMRFRCGSIDNYVKTGILSETEAKEIWRRNDSMFRHFL